MRRRRVAVLLWATLFSIPIVPAVGQGREGREISRTREGISVNFQDVDLAYVLAALAQAANLNVMYSKLPKISVTVRMSGISHAGLLKVMNDLARANGVSVIPDTANNMIRFSGSGDVLGAEPRSLYIYHLKHVKAPELAQTLRSLFTGLPSLEGQTGGRPVDPNMAFSTQIQLMQMRQQAEMMRQQMAAQGQAVSAGMFGGNITVVEDEASNALLIYATDMDWRVVKFALEQLDVRPLQVLIEVIIAEVSRTNDVTVGVGGKDKIDNTTVELPVATPDDFFTLKILKGGSVDIGATLSALATTGNLRVLSRPIVQAQNNQEAEFIVGQRRPFIQSSTTVPAGQVNTVNTVQYQDVATRLLITPTINMEGYVNMAVTQEILAPTGEVVFDAEVLSNRTAKTQLLARHGQTIAVGGLIDRQEFKSRSGIPLLKDIPLLGWLFGTTRKRMETRELFLFLTPYVVLTDEHADSLRENLEERLKMLKGLLPNTPIKSDFIKIPLNNMKPPRDSSVIRSDSTATPPDSNGTRRNRKRGEN